VTDDPRTLHSGAFLELIDRDGWEYAHRFATLGVVMVVAVDHGAPAAGRPARAGRYYPRRTRPPPYTISNIRLSGATEKGEAG
jgi:hypothetical protein